MTFQHLLVATDGSELSQRALLQALALAKALGARLRILTVEGTLPVSLVGAGELVDTGAIEALMKAAQLQSQQILDAAAATAEQAGVSAEVVKRISAQPSMAILEEARSQACDLIVMASHGRRGLQGLLLGSETQRVLTQSSCPVLVVR
ncbi:universal stress protein [Cyanobium sp. LEGE 06113]|jgi:nucleotide-binding universal stress UspA family protein|uniref:universal stress protein n=1 Tax=Cyanobium sp. LEGE 06113 TaxID=1297573 RepID=UPI00187F6703|nr:universal stress protein [Cyanobium sp. LEGE 06113]MBE9153694.1 universal stress protein [Cyanobium sp. LEGE 06113]